MALACSAGGREQPMSPAEPMRVLAVNAGSSSVKLALLGDGR